MQGQLVLLTHGADLMPAHSEGKCCVFPQGSVSQPGPRSRDQGHSPWWPRTQLPAWVAFWITLPQTLNPGAASISRAPARGRGAIDPHSGVWSRDDGDRGAPAVLSSELFPGCNWGSQRCMCPRCGHTS